MRLIVLRDSKVAADSRPGAGTSVVLRLEVGIRVSPFFLFPNSMEGRGALTHKRRSRLFIKSVVWSAVLLTVGAVLSIHPNRDESLKTIFRSESRLLADLDLQLGKLPGHPSSSSCA